MHKAAPTTKNYPVQNVNSSDVEKLHKSNIHSPALHSPSPRKKSNPLHLQVLNEDVCCSLSLRFSLQNPTVCQEDGFLPAVRHVIKVVEQEQTVLLPMQRAGGLFIVFGDSGKRGDFNSEEP